MIQEQLDSLWGTFLGQVRASELASPAARAFIEKYEGLMRLTPFQFQTEMLFMMRAMGVLSGLTANLDPEFDPWEETAPFALRLLQEDFLTEFVETFRSSARDIASGRFPSRLSWVLRLLSPGNPRPAPTPVLAMFSEEVLRLRRSVNRLTATLVILGIILAGAILSARDVHASDLMVQFWPADRLEQWFVLLVGAGVVIFGLRRPS